MSAPEATDTGTFEPGYGKGGVPWYLLVLYLSFLGFFTWYALEYQLVDFLEKQEAAGQAAEETPEDGG